MFNPTQIVVEAFVGELQVMYERSGGPGSGRGSSAGRRAFRERTAIFEVPPLALI